MKEISFLLLILISVYSRAQTTSSIPAIIPAPPKIKTFSGSLQLTANTPMRFDNNAQNLFSFPNKVFIAPIFDKYANRTLNTFGLQISLDRSLILSSEGYRLTVGNRGISIISKTKRGAFYELQTLIQLFPDSLGDGKINIPFVEI